MTLRAFWLLLSLSPLAACDPNPAGAPPSPSLKVMEPRPAEPLSADPHLGDPPARPAASLNAIQPTPER